VKSRKKTPAFSGWTDSAEGVIQGGLLALVAAALKWRIAA
jgi:hypothetical protein